MISTIDWGLIIDVVMVMHACSCVDLHYERNQKKTNMNECHHSKKCIFQLALNGLLDLTSSWSQQWSNYIKHLPPRH